MQKERFYRIIDANFNRSREGLRVCEDTARFILNSPTLTKDIKYIRHQISRILKESKLPSKSLFEHRDVGGDIGRPPKIKIETKRRGYNDIFIANIERAKESIRVLEEFFKLIDESASRRFSQLRFKLYDIEKRAVRRLSSLRNSR